jgi:hypothetical protein
MSESKAEVRPPSRFCLGRVLLLLVPLVVSVLLLGWGCGYYDVGNRISRWLLPPLIPVSGRVFLNAEPLGKADIFTEPVGRQCRGAMGMTDAEGRFTLRTDVDGDFFPGAYAGEHRVIVLGIDPNAPPGPFKPPLVTPPECENFETTPLRIQVDRDPSRNQVEFRLDHKAAAPKAGQGKRAQ